MLELIVVLKLVGVGLVTLCFLYILIAAVTWYRALALVYHLPKPVDEVPILGDLLAIEKLGGVHQHMRISGQKYNNYLCMLGNRSWFCCRDY